jgi:hypothetical protein
MDEDQASAGARSSRASLLHLWQGSSAAGATAFHVSRSSPTLPPWVKNLAAADPVGLINAGLAGEFTGELA